MEVNGITHVLEKIMQLNGSVDQDFKNLHGCYLKMDTVQQRKERGKISFPSSVLSVLTKA